MKKTSLLIILFNIILGIYCLIIPSSYAYDITYRIVGDKEKRLVYYNPNTNEEISAEEAISKYNYEQYEKINYQGKLYYFNFNKEISKTEYLIGSARIKADKRALEYGNSAYRVHNTDEVIKGINNIYQNNRTGTFTFVFSKYEEEKFDWNKIKNYYLTNYGLKTPYQNVYSYNIKGKFEPERFSPHWDESPIKEKFELSTSTRMPKNEEMIVNSFANYLVAELNKAPNDILKIYEAYSYLINTATYITDNGFYNDFVGSNTSAYDALINQKTVCIGYSIAFSFIMDRLGIESYIVDSLTSVNVEEESYASVHTYNVVKVGDKFYKIDITGKEFLKAMNTKLIGLNLNTSSKDYDLKNITLKDNLDYTHLNNMLNKVKMIKTTTTKQIYNTTTTTTRKIISDNKTTTKEVTDPTENPTNGSSNNQNTTSEKPGTTIIADIKTTNKIEKEQSKANNTKIVVNIILGGLFIGVIIIYLMYRNKQKHD